jgi:hypothetical protein
MPRNIKLIHATDFISALLKEIAEAGAGSTASKFSWIRGE